MADGMTPSQGGMRAAFRGDVLLAVGIMIIVVVLILPMPPFLLDFGLSLSLMISVVILMTALFIEKPLDLSSFPTILLITTMIRLALNIASTRLILSQGHNGHDAAGHVIEAFGTFVMQGNFVIGVIVFAILTIINFVVITKGAGRIAEVAARFSLDAMPGKQMAIDADLSAGLIDEAEARTRRSTLEQESTFFGSMDGASKFVRGDAIAGLLIVFINVIGGMIIGVAQQDLSAGEAADIYTHLTIGDGLVSQIPALIISIAAGLMVSKAGVRGSTDKALFAQLSNHPSALILSSASMLILGMLPNIPFFPFLIMAAIPAAIAYNVMTKRKVVAARAAVEKEESAKPPPVAEEPISKTLAIDNIRLEMGYGLLPLVNASEQSGKLTEQIKGLRRQLAEDMGFVLPSVRIQDNLQLPANTYVVRIKEIEAGRGEIRAEMLLCMNPTGDRIDLPGEATREPTFGLPAMWIGAAFREEANFKGYTVVDPSTVITTHLTEIIKDNMPELLSYAETQKLLDEMPAANQKLVADIIPAKISVTGLQRVLQTLVSERVSIRDLGTILEGVSEATAFTHHIGAITEHVRMRLARQICDQNSSMGGMLPLLTLSGEWEQAFAEALIGDGDDKQLAMAPSRLQQFITAVRAKFEEMAIRGESPALLTSPRIRPYVRSIVERFRPQTVVLSQNEIHPKAKIKTLGQIT